MPRRTSARRRANKYLLTRVGAREHVLAHWYAAVVRGKPVADLLRQFSVTELLAQAEAAFASGAFAVPREFASLTATPQLRQSA